MGQKWVCKIIGNINEVLFIKNGCEVLLVNNAGEGRVLNRVSKNRRQKRGVWDPN